MTHPELTLQIDTKSVREPNGSYRTLLSDTKFELSTSDTSVALLGRSGSGKTTLLRILAGLDASFKGQYVLDGKPLTKSLTSLSQLRRHHIGYITQEPTLLNGRTVLDNILVGLHHTPKTQTTAHTLLEQVGLAGYATRRVDRLSGGERQRVSLARALVRGPRIVLADEPTGSLDEETEAAILALLRQLQTDNVRFVIATHSSIIAQACQRSVKIENQKLVSVKHKPRDRS